APARTHSSFTDSAAATPRFDRRTGQSASPRGVERRQFGTAQNSGRPEVDELAAAVDRYKMENRRRFITYAELYDVVVSLGYERA
ncbi:MAG: hypothetical protein AAF907_12735, partial [Planctomycetota bacterium]